MDVLKTEHKYLVRISIKDRAVTGAKTAFFFRKLRKIAQRLGVSPPDLHSLHSLDDTFELQSLLYSTRLPI